MPHAASRAPHRHTARLVPDRPPRTAPDLTTDEGRVAFNRILNDRLPTKRAIAQGLLRNEDGEILLCELTYKADWDLPGGVVDPHESPAACVVREVEEELSLGVDPRGLIAVNWLPAYRGWDDAVLFLFDLGSVSARLATRARLLRREIRAVHWVGADDLRDHVAPYTAEMVRRVLAGDGRTAYLENSAVPERH